MRGNSVVFITRPSTPLFRSSTSSDLQATLGKSRRPMLEWMACRCSKIADVGVSAYLPCPLLRQTHLDIRDDRHSTYSTLACPDLEVSGYKDLKAARMRVDNIDNDHGANEANQKDIRTRQVARAVKLLPPPNSLCALSGNDHSLCILTQSLVTERTWLAQAMTPPVKVEETKSS